jgi:hypothetical protein
MGNSQWDTGGDDWVRRSRRVCDDKLMADIVGDAQRGDIHARAPVIPAKTNQTDTPTDRSGWREATPIKPPDGVALVDELVDMQDKLDAAQRARQLGLSHEEWARLSEADIKARKAAQEKKK